MHDEPGEACAQGKTILVADDEQSMRDLLSMLLEASGYNVLLASNVEEAMRVFSAEKGRINLVIQDLKMPGADGADLLRWLKVEDPDLPVIIITAFSTWDSAVDAMRLGAFDYIRKPFDTDAIRSVVARGLEKDAVRHGRMRRKGDEDRSGLAMIGNNPLIQGVFRMIELIAPTDSTVLIQGESGTGKEIVSRYIHHKSHRADRSFVPVNCSAFTESLLESELFGHVRGAFTGAIESQQGLFRAANGGTLFLDEVADMSLTTQVKILRVLEERRVCPVGSTELQPIDVRIIAATNKNIEEEVLKKGFREDLYYRLNVIPLFLPALRDRKDDIPLLAGHFLAKYSRQMGKQVIRISDKARQMLYDYDWPGNVRELENVIQRHVALSEGDTIEFLAIKPRKSDFLPPRLQAPRSPIIPPEGIRLEHEIESFERFYLREALRMTGGNLTSAAKLLGMTYRSIRYRVKKLKIKEASLT
ncbi:MAG TPA: sigma-54 dependent transcriptional regulator [Planctomycetota bacterium]|nr:sigma-54 dependent transcriptional regulator [Planctomycetota bacterium]